MNTRGSTQPYDPEADAEEASRSYSHRVQGCLFCDVQKRTKDRIMGENALAYAVRDSYPVTVMHTLIMPRRHVADYFGLYPDEIEAIHELLWQQHAALRQEDPSIAGFNIGTNCGPVAGQSIFHCHVHLIPRRAGDTPSPKGGVRHVIPDRAKY